MRALLYDMIMRSRFTRRRVGYYYTPNANQITNITTRELSIHTNNTNIKKNNSTNTKGVKIREQIQKKE